jgi:hypothetical protein
VCCGWRTPPTAHSNRFQLFHVHVYWNILTMHGPINVKSPNITSKWQMGFNSAFKGLISCYNTANLWTYIRLIQMSLHSRYSDSLRDGRSGNRIRVGARFSTPVQTGSGPIQPPIWVPDYSRGLSGRGVALTTHTHLARD